MKEKDLKDIKRRMNEQKRLYDQYIKYAKKKDFVKASEFLWGSISNIVCAIARFYGKSISRHGDTLSFIEELDQEKKYEEHINAINALHSNFYHGWMDEKGFLSYARKAEELRKWLLGKLNEEEEKLSSK